MTTSQQSKSPRPPVGARLLLHACPRAAEATLGNPAPRPPLLLVLELPLLHVAHSSLGRWSCRMPPSLRCLRRWRWTQTTMTSMRTPRVLPPPRVAAAVASDNQLRHSGSQALSTRWRAGAPSAACRSTMRPLAVRALNLNLPPPRSPSLSRLTLEQLLWPARLLPRRKRVLLRSAVPLDRVVCALRLQRRWQLLH